MLSKKQKAQNLNRPCFDFNDNQNKGVVPILTKEKVRPSDFNIETHLMGSQLHKSEKETIARNIILLSKWNGDV